MTRPKMILFDYGQTLVDEHRGFSPLEGTRAVMAHAVKNPRNVTPEEVQRFAETIIREQGCWNPAGPPALLEVHNHAFNRYLYDYFNIETGLSPLELEQLFFDTAAPGIPTPHSVSMLARLRELSIPTGVISNISFSGECLSARIRQCFPDHAFTFILASSEYMFRKPSTRLFELALRKAMLSPEEVWFFGDNPVCDVEGAYQSGMIPFWYKGARSTGARSTEKAPPACPHRVMEDWEELMALLADAD